MLEGAEGVFLTSVGKKTIQLEIVYVRVNYERLYSYAIMHQKFNENKQG